MKLFDSHCHLDDSVYDPDFEAVLERARNAGVSAMMIAGINLKTSQKAVALSEAHQGNFCRRGIPSPRCLTGLRIRHEDA